MNENLTRPEQTMAAALARCVLLRFQPHSRLTPEPLRTTAAHCARRQPPTSAWRQPAAAAFNPNLGADWRNMRPSLQTARANKKIPRSSLLAEAPKPSQTARSGRRRMKGDANTIKECCGTPRQNSLDQREKKNRTTVKSRL